MTFDHLAQHTAEGQGRAYTTASEAILENPDCWRAHRGLAHTLLHLHRQHYAIAHLRAAIEGAALEQGRESRIITTLQGELASAFLQAGRPAEAEALYQTVAAAEPGSPAVKFGLDRAHEKLKAVGPRTENGHPLLNRAKELERNGDYAGAWRAIETAKKDLKDKGYYYSAEQAEARLGIYRQWCTKRKIAALVRVLPSYAGELKPIFVLGYPRSGTTLIEQILTSHPTVTGAGEMQWITELTMAAPNVLHSRRPYPACLDELLLADTAVGIEMLRAFYVGRARERGFSGIITDKMCLNECHLPLLHLLFPAAPKILVHRHPLDVVMSNYSLFLTHGSHQACDPQSAWHHLTLVNELTAHYRRKIPDLKLLLVPYEALVQTPEFWVRRLAEFCGLDYRDEMLHPETNPRYAHTASYAQVRTPINAAGVGRWRHYETQLRAAIPGAFST